MNEVVIAVIISVVIGYACGCFLTAYFVAKKFAGKDISEIGTGNPGMANVMARVGKFPGFIVLGGDILKTVIALFASTLIFWNALGLEAMLWSGLGVLLGHNFPFWRKFKGGKGVAVTCAWIILYMPFGGIVSAVAGGIVVLLTGLLPLGAVLIAAFAVPFAYIEHGAVAAIIMFISAIIMLYRNYPGFIRGFKNEEKREFKRERTLKNSIGTIATFIVVAICFYIDWKII